jgi:hypothetical protein
MRDSDLALLQTDSWELAQIKVTPANANMLMKIGDMRSRRPPRPSFRERVEKKTKTLEYNAVSRHGFMMPQSRGLRLEIIAFPREVPLSTRFRCAQLLQLAFDIHCSACSRARHLQDLACQEAGVRI